MSATIRIQLPADTWTDITSTLTDTVAYSVQSRSGSEVYLYESATPPTDANLFDAFILFQKEIISIRPETGFEVYARPKQGAGNVIIGEAV